MPSGGPRPNSGRPRKQGEGWVTTSIVIQPSLLAAIDEAAKRSGQSRSEWIREAARARLGRAQIAKLRRLFPGD